MPQMSASEPSSSKNSTDSAPNGANQLDQAQPGASWKANEEQILPHNNMPLVFTSLMLTLFLVSHRPDEHDRQSHEITLNMIVGYGPDHVRLFCSDSKGLAHAREVLPRLSLQSLKNWVEVAAILGLAGTVIVGSSVKSTPH